MNKDLKEKKSRNNKRKKLFKTIKLKFIPKEKEDENLIKLKKVNSRCFHIFDIIDVIKGKNNDRDNKRKRIVRFTNENQEKINDWKYK